MGMRQKSIRDDMLNASRNSVMLQHNRINKTMNASLINKSDYFLPDQSLL